MRFDQLQLTEPILRAVRDEGYETPTPIQVQAIPLVLEGRDVLGCAQTGTGKTAAFALPILHNLFAHKHEGKRSNLPRCLVLAPTRELAQQIADGFQTYGKHLPVRGAVIFGGVGQNPQVAKLRRGIDVLIATPGRLLDLMNQGHVTLSQVSTLVLDEADRMLDMGFIDDVRRITSKVPADRQTLLFSATMPAEVRQLADALLRDPATVRIAAATPTVELIDQSVRFVDRAGKIAMLARLVHELHMTRAIVFSRTKHGADRIVRQLHKHGIRAEAIHGNKSQNARQRALDNFRAGKIPMLVATDIAARGIDVDGVTHVVNYDLTHEPETYVHRIGRTARAGAAGVAISFCDHDEVAHLRAIERLLRKPIPVVGHIPPHADPRAAKRPAAPPKPQAGWNVRSRAGKRPPHGHGGKRRQSSMR